jgi:hypothetical protein
MNKTSPVIQMLIKQKTQDLKTLHQKYMEDPKYVYIKKNMISLISDLLKTLELTSTISSELVESFELIYYKYSAAHTFQEFRECVIGWINMNKLEWGHIKTIKEKYNLYLHKLKKYYESLIPQAEKTDQSTITKILSEINIKINEFSKIYYFENPILCFREKLFELEEKSLKEIFGFFGMQHITIGKYTTFQTVKDQQENWNCGLFIKFFGVFGIYKQPSKIKNSVSRNTLIETFKHNSFLKKNMDFDMFKNALGEISESYFNQDYDKANHLEFSLLPLKLKTILLIEKMKLADFRRAKIKLKQSIVCFSKPDYKPRIPENDPSSAYKFVVDTPVRVKLQKIKLAKLIENKKKYISRKSVDNTELKIKIRPTSYKSTKSLKKNPVQVNFFRGSQPKLIQDIDFH